MSTFIHTNHFTLLISDTFIAIILSAMSLAVNGRWPKCCLRHLAVSKCDQMTSPQCMVCVTRCSVLLLRTTQDVWNLLAWNVTIQCYTCRFLHVCRICQTSMLDLQCIYMQLNMQIHTVFVSGST